MSGPAFAGAGPATGGGIWRRPVVLVADPVEGFSLLGVPGEGRMAGGVYEALRRRGHVPGRDLFLIEFRPGEDFARTAGRLLPQVVARALARTGAGRVDLVAAGGGALAARFYVERLDGHRFVANLVMVRPPFHGSHLLTAYRELGVAETAVRARRASGRGRGRELVQGAPRMAFTSEVEYVDGVSFRYFEPLYGEFVTELAETPPGARSWPSSFPAWLRERRPAEYRAAFEAAAGPPRLEAGGRRLSWDAGPGETLSRGYLNRVALDLAAYSYRQFEPWLRTAVSGWERDLVWEGDWRSTIRDFLLRRVQVVGAELVRRRGTAWARGAVLAGGKAVTGVAALDPSLHHLVAEEVPFPGREEENLPANAGLLALNGGVARRQEGGGGAARTRYVSVVLLPPRWVVPLLGEAGGALTAEAESQYLAPGLLDEIEAVAAALALPGLGRLTGAFAGHALAAAVLRALEGPRLVSAPPSPGAGGRFAAEGEAIARVGRPVLVEVGAVPPGAEVTVETLANPPPGLRFAPFLVVTGEEGVRRVIRLRRLRAGERSAWHLPAREMPATPADGGLLLGARLLPRGKGGLATLLREDGLAFRFTVGAPAGQDGAGEGPVSREAGVGARPRREPPGSHRPSSARQAPPHAAPGSPPGGRADGSGAGSRGAGRQVRGEAGGEEAEITATYRNKHTSLWEEERTYHVRWEWDFGDGSTWVDADPDHTTSRVNHLFPPGEYLVRARSWSNRGTVLREVVFRVRVREGGAEVSLVAGGGSDGNGPERGVGGGGGTGGREAEPETSAFRERTETVTLTAETAREPPVALELVGPRLWVTGRDAVFRIRVRVGRVPRLVGTTLTFDPGERFTVRWRKPGTFRVRGAVRVVLVYRFPEGDLRLHNTYVVERPVEVLAPSVTARAGPGGGAAA